MRISVAILALMLVSVGAGAQPSVVPDLPREYGHFIGDILIHRAMLTLPEGNRLDRASLPRPRSVTYWLDLRAVEVTQDGQRIEIVSTYQTFYSPLEPKRMTVPGFPLRLEGRADPTELRVPEWTFVTSPIRPILARVGEDVMKPDAAFTANNTRAEQIATAVWSAVALAGLAGLVWHQAWPPFGRRAGRPFTAAHRRIARLAREGGPEALRAACLRLHRALDAAYGRPLLSADLDSLLAEQTEFATERKGLERFFTISGDVFFGDCEAGDNALSEVHALSRALADRERGR